MFVLYSIVFHSRLFSEGEEGVPTGKTIETINIYKHTYYIFKFPIYISGLLKRWHFLVLVTIELQTKVDTSGTSWEFIGTNCKSLPVLNLPANRLYIKQCALSIGQSYTLACMGGDQGWFSNHLVIENSKYCENTLNETTVNITITGKCQS